MKLSAWKGAAGAVALLAASVAGIAVAEATDGTQTMTGPQTITGANDRASIKGPGDWFTGDVRIDPLFPANETAHYSGAYVTFEPGARSDWHHHPAGQHMIVTAGVGRTGTRDGVVVEIRAGDVIWCPPGVEHWHGAAPDTAMTHLVITGTQDGKAVYWAEAVTDAQYSGKHEE